MPTPSLDFVKSQFDAWRASSRKSWKTPDYLMKQVIPLIELYGMSKVLSTLTLNSVRVKAYREKYFQKNNLCAQESKKDFSKSEEAPAFLSVPLPGNFSEDSTIELIRSDGLTLRFKKIEHSTLSTLLTSFLGNTLCCN